MLLKKNGQPCAQTHSGAVLDQVKDYDVIACDACGFAHISPLPTPEELAAIYSREYYSDVKPDYLARAKEDAEWAQLTVDDKLSALEEKLPASRRRLLDIGSGPGFFLLRAQERGWAAEGIDPSEQACAHAKSLGVRVTEGFFTEQSAQSLGLFDAITLTNMLEHVADPINLIELAHGSLSPNGLLCVTVPNDYNMLQSTLRTADGIEPWWVAPPHHLNYFNFDTLSNLLSRSGFRPLARQTSFPMELFALMGDIYMNDVKLGRACHQKRVKFDTSFARAGQPLARQKFYEALANAGIGREAIIIAEKA